jgi:hypothetical protein
LAEFKAAVEISDPVASAAALKRFIVKRRPGAATAAAWAAVTAGLLEAKAPSLELISAGRLSLSHLSLVGQTRMAAAVADGVATELDRRHDFPEVIADFRKLSEQLKRN